LLNYLRAKTYALGAGLDEEKKIFNPRNLFKIKRLPEAIVPETTADKLEAEIAPLREHYKVWTEKNYEVFIAPTSAIPCAPYAK
jgi:hypothetical protein